MTASEYPVRHPGPGLGRLGARLRARELPADIWILLALLAVAAVIRLLVIDNQSFWADEALTAYETHLGFGPMLHTVAHIETTPPLYFVAIWLWAHVFGSGEVALRLPSTLAGIALVPIAFLSARELVSRWAGVLAGAFVAVNPFLIWYSQEARAYMLLAALTGASFLWFIRARQDPSRRNLVWWAACSALAVMTHFFAGFLIAPEAIWLLYVSRKRAVIVAVGVVTAVQLAMLPLALIDTSHQAGWIARVPRLSRISTMATEWAASLLTRRVAMREGLVGGAIFLAVVAALIVFGGDRRTRSGAKVAAVLVGFVWLAPLALGIAGHDYFLSRNEIPAFVPLATVVAAACTAPRTRVLGAALAIALLAGFSFATLRVQTHPELERPDWRQVARALGPTSVPRVVLVADGTTADPLKIYMPHVNWVQPQSRRVMIDEVDVVGAIKRLPLAINRPSVATASLGPPPRVGSPVPRKVAPPGARLIARFRVDNWILARFALRHPIRVSIHELIGRAPLYFLRTPRVLLLFFQQPGR
jgi:mannosyltransferase